MQTTLNNTVERINALEDIVARTVIRAPESGLVNGMQVHTEGGVITPGMRIVDIVPETDDLVIEAQVSAQISTEYQSDKRQQFDFHHSDPEPFPQYSERLLTCPLTALRMRPQELHYL